MKQPYGGAPNGFDIFRHQLRLMPTLWLVGPVDAATHRGDRGKAAGIVLREFQTP